LVIAIPKCPNLYIQTGFWNQHSAAIPSPKAAYGRYGTMMVVFIAHDLKCWFESLSCFCTDK